jgi:hypothetical protein
MNNEKNELKMEMLQRAIELIEEAQSLVDEVMGGSAHYESYGRYGFDQLLGNGNEYDTSLFDVAETLEAVDETCEECGSSVRSPENTLCDPCNDRYENRCDAQTEAEGVSND